MLFNIHANPDTTYPREGTETCLSSRASLSSADTTYPREGTETLLPWLYRRCGDDTTYPREGTETEKMQLLSILKSGHNLSPRGDGNIMYAIDLRLVDDTTYPREGTETPCTLGWSGGS